MPFVARFKDGHIIRSDVVGGSGNSGSVYEVASVKADDVGQYMCRAVSLGGKIFSRVASLVVKGERRSIVVVQFRQVCVYIDGSRIFE